MNLSPQEYDKLVRQMAPRSPLGKNTALAFAVGGAICCLGQAIRDGWAAAGLADTAAATAASISLVFLSALFTGLGQGRWYPSPALPTPWPPPPSTFAPRAWSPARR